jgi:hypothetical protein
MRIFIINKDGSEFAANAALDDLEVTIRTAPTNGVAISNTQFNLFGFEAGSIGEFGNNMSYDLCPDMDVDKDYVDSLKAWPVRITYGEYSSSLSTFIPFPTTLSSKSISFVTDRSVIDPSTKKSASLETKASVYYNTDILQPLRTVVNNTAIKAFYETLAVALIGRATNWLHWVALYELYKNPEKVGLFNLSLFASTPEAKGAGESYTAAASASATVDLGLNVDVGTLGQISLDVERADSTSRVGGLSPNVYLQLQGGSDGAMNIAEALDTRVGGTSMLSNKLIEFWLNASDSELCDMPRCPFNTLVDTGHATDVKLAMMNIYTIRKDVNILFSAWDGLTNEKTFTEATAAITTASLVSMIRMYKASVLHGTDAFRAAIFENVGYIPVLEFNGMLPHTIWANRKMHSLCGTRTIKGNLEAANALCEDFVKTTFVPYKPSTKETLWGMGGNYAQHWSMAGLHYGSIRTVYPDLTSILSNMSYVYALIFLMQSIPAIWKDYSGSTASRLTNYAGAKKAIMDAATNILNGLYRPDVEIYQTVEDELGGFSDSIDFSLYGENGQRIWNVNFIAKRSTGEA